MRIERNYDTAPVELADFAERYGLTLDLTRAMGKYLAEFCGVAVQNGSCLLSQGGVGTTENEAVRNYACLIRGRRLVRHVAGVTREEIDVPHTLQHTRPLTS